MTTMPAENAITIKPIDLEHLIRRAVKEAVHEELGRLLQTPNRALLEYWLHEGPDDPAGDEQLLAEALAVIEQHKENPEGWKTLEEFEAELNTTGARNTALKFRRRRRKKSERSPDTFAHRPSNCSTR